MGDCYSVEMRIKVKGSKQNLAKIMYKWMKEAEKDYNLYPAGINWSWAAYRKEGVRPDSLEGIVKILLSGWKSQPVSHKVDEEGFDIYRNGFSASYGWGPVMVDTFTHMSMWLEDGSYLYIDRDEGTDEIMVQGGQAWQQLGRGNRQMFSASAAGAKSRLPKSGRKTGTTGTRSRRTR